MMKKILIPLSTFLLGFIVSSGLFVYLIIDGMEQYAFGTLIDNMSKEVRRNVDLFSLSDEQLRCNIAKRTNDSYEMIESLEVEESFLLDIEEFEIIKKRMIENYKKSQIKSYASKCVLEKEIL